MIDKRHILLIEDEEHLSIGIQFNLEAEGYVVHAVADGKTALAHFSANPDDVDLVVLDLMLPGMSGYDVCEELRKTHQQLPILILSARTLPEDRTRGFNVGADQYLTKPFELDELLSRVKNLLARADREKGAPTANRVFQFADATINFDTFEVIVGGKPIRMTALELKLLEYFVQHEGRVIPRSELLERVWEMPANMNTRAPDQFIRRLRKTFEPRPSEPRHFLTLRDAGYRFLSTGENEE
jgi:DNA-binding response OmpR family regulator